MTIHITKSVPLTADMVAAMDAEELNYLIAMHFSEVCRYWDSRDDGKRHSKQHIGQFSPGTHIADAWPLVVSLGMSVVKADDGWYAFRATLVTVDSVGGTDVPLVSCELREHEEYPSASATAPLAICRCALLTKLKEKPK